MAFNLPHPDSFGSLLLYRRRLSGQPEEVQTDGGHTLPSLLPFVAQEQRPELGIPTIFFVSAKEKEKVRVRQFLCNYGEAVLQSVGPSAEGCICLRLRATVKYFRLSSLHLALLLDYFVWRGGRALELLGKEPRTEIPHGPHLRDCLRDFQDTYQGPYPSGYCDGCSGRDLPVDAGEMRDLYLDLLLNPDRMTNSRAYQRRFYLPDVLGLYFLLFAEHGQCFIQWRLRPESC